LFEKVKDASLSRVELMEKIAGEVRVCDKCPLWEGRRKAVPGEGDINTSIMLVGEAPGY
jgi:DNA polymerase